MALSTFPNPISLNFVLLFTLSFSGYGEETPEHTVAQTMSCFDNKIIYNGCESAYRLNPSGNINLPDLEATNRFCNGPCLIETQRLLTCLDHTFQNFLFYNKASSQNVRDALRMGCSYSTQRGNFNPGWFLQGEISRAHDIFQNWITYSFILLVGYVFIL